MSAPTDVQQEQVSGRKRFRWLLVAATILATASAACTIAAEPTAIRTPAATPPAVESREPTPAPGTLTLQLAAVPTLTFDKLALAAPASTPFAIDFNNKEVGAPHNVQIQKGTGHDPVMLSRGPVVFAGSAIFGPDRTQYYLSTGLATGQYTFFCSIHPQMYGTLTVQ
jgi:hypothetical protein